MGACASNDAPAESKQHHELHVKFEPRNGFRKQKLNKTYRQYRKLGDGASCKVVVGSPLDGVTDFKGEPVTQQVAIKMLKKRTRNKDTGKMDENKENKYLWKQEVRILQEVSFDAKNEKVFNHPNILNYIDAFEDDKYYCIITQLCSGGELFDRVARSDPGGDPDKSFKYSEADAAKLATYMLKAVAHCHARNIAHRDLKPENFVFDGVEETANMRLIDFGCASQQKDSEVVKDVAGSAYYVAPEVLNSSFVRTGGTWKASDMWSIGVIIYLLTNGTPPFDGSTIERIYSRIRRGKFKFRSDIKLSSEVKDLIRKLLILDPSKRLTVEQALDHAWIQTDAAPDTPLQNIAASIGSFQKSCRLKKAVRRMMANELVEEDKKLLEEIFKKYDKNGNGKLEASEIAAMLKDIGSDHNANDVLQEFDDDGDGTIDIKEFQALHVKHADEKLMREEMKRRFQEFDADGDGFVSPAELQRVLNIKADEAKRMVSEVDKDGNGEIDFNEWMQAMGIYDKKNAN